MKKLPTRDLIKLLVVFAISGVLIFLSQRNFNSAAKLIKKAELNLRQVQLIDKEFSSIIANPAISNSEFIFRGNQKIAEKNALLEESNRMLTQHWSHTIYGWLFGIIGLGLPIVYLILRWAVAKYSAVEP